MRNHTFLKFQYWPELENKKGRFRIPKMGRFRILKVESVSTVKVVDFWYGWSELGKV